MKNYVLIRLAGFSAINGVLVKVAVVPREGERIIYDEKEYAVSTIQHHFHYKYDTHTITAFLTPLV
jgi:hypothetical protein